MLTVPVLVGRGAIEDVIVHISLPGDALVSANGPVHVALFGRVQVEFPELERGSLLTSPDPPPLGASLSVAIEDVALPSAPGPSTTTPAP